MIIERIDEKRLLIVLEGHDMLSLGIEYEDISWEDRDSRIIMAKLLALAETETGFSIGNCKLSIEALPQYDGCAIIFTKYPRTNAEVSLPKRKFKDSDELKPEVYIFNDMEDIFVFCEKLSYIGFEFKDSSIFRVKNRYYILVYHDSKLPISVEVLLNEYGTGIRYNKLMIFHLNESGNLIKGRDALTYISKCLK